jgi:hypothetical protein
LELVTFSFTTNSRDEKQWAFSIRYGNMDDKGRQFKETFQQGNMFGQTLLSHAKANPGSL